MASCILARRASSQLRNLPPTSHQRVMIARALACPALSQDDSAVEVGRGSASEKNQQPGMSRQGGQEKFVSSRGWPGSLFPSLFSPLFPSLMRPTSLMQMMDTIDQVIPSLDSPATSSFKGRMPWDVIEDKTSFKLRMDMPGMSKQNVKLTVEDGDLVVKAENKAEENEDEWSTRSYGSHFSRIKLPENIDVNSIKAEMKDGVLKVTAPKVESVKAKHEVQIE